MKPNLSEVERATDQLSKAIDRYEQLVAEEKYESQNLALYAAKLNIYGNSSLELTKALMTLSSGAIGLLIALPTYRQDSALSGFTLIATIIAFAAFILCVCSTIYILKTNGNFLIDSITNKEKAAVSACKLRFAESLSIVMFAIGIMGAISLATHGRIYQKEMSDDRQETIPKTTPSAPKA